MKNTTVKALSFVIACIAMVVLMLLLIFWPLNNAGQNSYQIVTTNFIGYDLARAITGGSSNIKMLLKPGTDAHNYEPTPQDIMDIEKANLFIYVGGESDQWVEELLQDNAINDEHTLRLMQLIAPLQEKIIEGMTEDGGGVEDGLHADIEYDEHIWTSPKNTIALIEGIKNKLTELYPENAQKYSTNADAYITSLEQADQTIANLVASSTKGTLIFGDRFPFRYFVEEYGLKYYAAFPGCAEQTEASSATISFLIDKAKAENIDTILKIELSDGKLAETIAEEVGAKVLELHSGHNISWDDFSSGTTYVDIINKNIKTLEEALN